MKFWKDRWCGDGHFCASFPTFFNLPSSKKALSTGVVGLE